MSFRERNVINGSYGECWVGSDYVATVQSLKAEITLEFDDIKKPRKTGKYKKLLEHEGEGELVFKHVSSRLTSMVLENLQNGRQTEVSIISKLADPDAKGDERILIKDAVIGNIPLADWEAAASGEKTVSFTFTEAKFLDEID